MSPTFGVARLVRRVIAPAICGLLIALPSVAVLSPRGVHGSDAGPLGRSGHVMAYDADSDRIVLFGGAGAEAFLDDTWTYDFNSNAWTNMSPEVHPSARVNSQVAYDEDSDLIILFGGFDGPTGKPLGDTWAYDLNANTWTQWTPANPPPPRTGGAMAYDVKSDLVILFGGGVPLSDETWAFDSDTNTWTRMNPQTRPEARVDHAMAYDSKADRTILFGGTVYGGWGRTETWAYDANADAWTQLEPVAAPTEYAAHAMAYHPPSARVVLFGGCCTPSEALSDETWSFELETVTWENRRTGSNPGARGRSAMAYDGESSRIILFGGSEDPSVWAYDLDANAWTEAGTATPPGGFSDLVVATVVAGVAVAVGILVVVWRRVRKTT